MQKVVKVSENICLTTFFYGHTAGGDLSRKAGRKEIPSTGIFFQNFSKSPAQDPHTGDSKIPSTGIFFKIFQSPPVQGTHPHTGGKPLYGFLSNLSKSLSTGHTPTHSGRIPINRKVMFTFAKK